MLRRRKQKCDKIQRRNIGKSQNRKSKVVIPILITENKNTQPLLGLDWLDKLELGLQGRRNTNIIRNKPKDAKNTIIFNEFEDLFKNNGTIEGLTIDIQLKKDIKPIQQKKIPVPIHFQNTVRHELEKLIEKDTWKKRNYRKLLRLNGRQNNKKDKLVKIALDSRKLNESCIKRN